MQKQQKQGFSLLEIMLSVFVITVGVVGIYGLAPRLIKTAYGNKDSFIAAQLAQEAVEIVRNFREENWLSGNDWASGLENCLPPLGCEIDYSQSVFSIFSDSKLLIDSNGFFNYQFGTATKFTRKIIIDSVDWQKEMEITVQVTWPGEFSPFSVTSKLYNWL